MNGKFDLPKYANAIDQGIHMQALEHPMDPSYM